MNERSESITTRRFLAHQLQGGMHGVCQRGRHGGRIDVCPRGLIEPEHRLFCAQHGGTHCTQRFPKRDAPEPMRLRSQTGIGKTSLSGRPENTESVGIVDDEPGTVGARQLRER